jgi:hypothetical protein
MRVNRSYTLTAVVAFASFLAVAAGAEAAIFLQRVIKTQD